MGYIRFRIVSIYFVQTNVKADLECTTKNNLGTI